MSNKKNVEARDTGVRLRKRQMLGYEVEYWSAPLVVVEQREAIAQTRRARRSAEAGG